MWRVAFFCSVLTLTTACGEGLNAPNVNTDRLPRLAAGDPPPPPLDGSGEVTFFRSDVDITVTQEVSVTQEVCVPPPAIPLILEGTYLQNRAENNAWVHFRPIDGTGSGMGTIHEKARDPDQNASGTLVVRLADMDVQIHLRDYVGTSLFAFQPGDFFGALAGSLVAEVVACGENIMYTGAIVFEWVCSECGKKDF